jgi:C1A family cysteine protease
MTRQRLLRTLVLGLGLSLARSGHAQDSQKLGFIEATPDDIARSAAFKFKATRDVLPKKLLLTDYLPPVGNQGNQGSCAGWATAYYCYSAVIAKQRKLTPDQRSQARFQFSPAFLYHLVNGGVDGGSKMRDIFDILEKQGCASLAEMPYSDKDLITPPSPDAIKRGGGYKTRQAGVIFRGVGNADATELKRFLVETQNPFVLAIPIYRDFPGKGIAPDFVYNLTMEPIKANLRGGHAICIVGYDDDKKAFRMVNSWGKGWGDSGFLWLSEEFVTKHAFEAWGVKVAGGVVARDPAAPVAVSKNISLEFPKTK